MNGTQLFRLIALLLAVAGHVLLAIAFFGGTAGCERDECGNRERVSSVSLRSGDTIPTRTIPSDNHARKTRSAMRGVSARDVSVGKNKISRELPSRYFPVYELTAKPRVVKDLPPKLALLLPNMPAQSAVLVLLINERGMVDRVEIEQPQLPETAVRLLRRVFSTLEFSAGKIGDMPVKSRLRIEVRLADEPTSQAGRM